MSAAAARTDALGPEDTLWTRAVVAKYLSVSEDTVRRLRIPRVVLPGSRGQRGIVRYDPKEVKAFVEARVQGRVKPATPARRIT